MTSASDRRRPAVAGRFYPGEPAALDEEVKRRLAEGASPAAPRRRLAVMAPHAGYVYSGGIAGRVFAATEVPRRVIVLAPNHTGRGRVDSGAVWTRGAFELPGFAIPVDEELCARLTASGEGPLAPDREAHQMEHALEVELPFLRARRGEFLLTPIILGGLELDECLDVGARLALAVAALGEDVLVVASSDMNHYLSDEETRRIDRRALDPLLALDAERLYRTVRDEDISMCGVVPATAMLAYARARGAEKAELVGYATSGDAFGERDRVVGYAGVTVD
jgi:MEMO1 family protein